ncbi:MAG: adenylate/guanylate cyclase domain-containing protein [Sulfitobacter sp.]|nr:adenylate/guanylate cyclase domain-containing protein [Sulfitobacter sp.]
MNHETETRRLSAIMATDVVGFSRMMAADETSTLAALNQHRATLFDPAVARHAGRIVKLMGDGALVEFPSVIEAVACACEIQCAARDDPQSSPSIQLRIGINLGDIIIQDHDIYGDGVNIAARLEQLAPPGGICVSAAVEEIIRGRLQATFVSGGEVQVKNIDRPLRIFKWTPDGSLTEGDAAPPRPQPAKPVIAVLPFQNRSGDPEQEYFSDGISEDIITDLSKISGVTVIARNSSFAYKGKPVDLSTLGATLGATNVLQGSVRRAGQRVRITAELVEAASGAQIWADRYDRDLTDLFAVQDEVTLEIVNALKLHLSPAEKENVVRLGTESVAAHEHFMRMRGLLLYPGMDAKLWRGAVADGARALELDPDFAQAHAVLAIMHVLDYHNQWSGLPPQEALETAAKHAARALELAPDDVLPNHASAACAFWQGDQETALRLIEKVLRISPDYALGHFTKGEILLTQSRFREAILGFERAIRLDPAVRHQYLQFLAISHFLSGHYETAALMFRERVTLVPSTDIGRAWLAAALAQVGDTTGAGEVWAELRQMEPDFDFRARLARMPFIDDTALEQILGGLSAAALDPDN